MLSDGLGRYSAVTEVRCALKDSSDSELEQFDTQYEYAIALFAPVHTPLSWDVAGQLFHDFNAYAWNPNVGKIVSTDQLNPYVRIARLMNEPGTVIRRVGGLKSGSNNLGKRTPNSPPS